MTKDSVNTTWTWINSILYGSFVSLQRLDGADQLVFAVVPPLHSALQFSGT